MKMPGRLSVSLSEKQRVWLEKQSEETGATIAGVIRGLVNKEIIKEKNAKSEDTKGN
jgi:hypothetical protein